MFYGLGHWLFERGVDSRSALPELIPCSSVIPNALEPPVFNPAPISFDPPRILCLGRLVPEKGLDLALSAFESVCRRFPRARLVVAGEGPQAGKLKQQQTIELGLTDCVEFVGPRRPRTEPGKHRRVQTPESLPGRGKDSRSKDLQTIALQPCT